MTQSRTRLFPRRSGGRRTALAVPSRPAALAERLEHTQGMDRVARALARSFPLARQGRRADALHGVWLGQPVHPALTDIPAGLWMSAAALDFVPGSRRASRVLIALGLAGTIPAAATGFADYAALHLEQQRVGIAHAASSAGASALFAASLLARITGRETGGRLLALGGVTALAAGTYLGRYVAFPLGAGASHAEPVTHLAPLGWHELCPVSDLPDGVLTRRQLGYLSLAVLRQRSQVLVLADRCAHLGGPLHKGTVTEAGGQQCIRCPWHGSTFRLSDGTVVHGPATARQPAFDARIADGGMVQVRPSGPGLHAPPHQRPGGRRHGL